jgi:hypothetical protein
MDLRVVVDVREILSLLRSEWLYLGDDRFRLSLFIRKRVSAGVTTLSWIQARDVAESRQNPARMAGNNARLKTQGESEERRRDLVASADGFIGRRSARRSQLLPHMVTF